IVVNAARDAGRVQRRRRMTLERFFALHARDRAAVADVLDVLPDEELIAGVRALPNRARAVVALRYGADLDFATIGGSLGMTPSAARATCTRALTMLRARVGVVAAPQSLHQTPEEPS
ncbi:MAG: sigma-70 family RNA polymerase sigma factor, partial [Candidatus Dormibacteraceae bacterium]